MGAHAESFGLFSDELEKLAELTDWVMGSAAEMRSAGDDGEKNTRWNANAFWNLKAAVWDDLSDEGKLGAEKLDFFVSSTLSRLEAHLAVLANTGSSERSSHEGLALDWANKAKAHADASGVERLSGAGSKVVQAAQEAPAWNATYVVDDRYSTAFKDAGKDLITGSLLGIPTWAWLVGAAALVWMVYGPKVSR